ncbi:MAG: GNAT family N-acetyltransferase [Lewinellaceae bacterium]|nr:GNAT family N-acetyltransferase [Lewinellaceae bacterium]HPQ99193.1 GNAT family N-acetyltransferase [Saprospiraceae bacterium]
MEFTFYCKPFEELNNFEVYHLLALRQLVFAVEQQCIYLDPDGKDLNAYHVLGYDTEGKLIACARLLRDPKWPGYASFGRIISHPDVRGKGAGRALLNFVMVQMATLFPNEPIRIGAQSYLLQYYQAVGFQRIGAEYLEDGIPHCDMVKVNSLPTAG